MFRSVIETIDIDGNRKEIIIHLHTVMPPAHQKDWSRVIYSLEDITERVRLEAQLRQSQKTTPNWKIKILNMDRFYC